MSLSPPLLSQLQPLRPEQETLFEDDFETGEGEWTVLEEPGESIYVSDGRLVMEVHDANFTFALHPEFTLLNESVLESDLSYISGPNDSEAGITFRCIGEGGERLQIVIDADGFFSVLRVSIVEGQLGVLDLIPWTRSAAIKRGEAVNHTRIIDDDRHVTVLINDELVTSFPNVGAPPG